MGLTTKQKDVLEKITAFAGYVTVDNIARYSKINHHSAYKFLKRLVDLGYLKPLDYFTSFNRPLVYQVKLKACRELNRGDPYMRKTHSRQAIHKYLIYSHFCFSLITERNYDFADIITNTKDRVSYLMAKGFSKEVPQKFNYNKKTGAKDGIYQVEEFILKAPPFAVSNGIGIAYADKSWQTPFSQLQLIIARYQGLVLKADFPIVITIITETKTRLVEYIDLYEKRLKKTYGGKLKLIGYSINFSYEA